MARYVRYPMEVDPNTIAQAAYNYLIDAIPGWLPNTGNLDTIMLEGMSLEAAQVRELAQTVTDDIFRWYGMNLMSVQPIEAASSQVNSTWTAIDSVGHTIPANAQVGIRDSLGELFVFSTLSEIVIPVGNTATAPGAVGLISILPGQAANNLGGNGTAAELIDVFGWVDAVTLTGLTAGGVDEESDVDYLDRLVEQLSLLSQRPILPRDFEIWARSVPGVARAMALDNYDPVANTYTNERMVAVAVIDSNGNALSTPLKAQVDTLLEAIREVNFVVNVIDPTYTIIDVVYAIKILDGFSTADVISTVSASLSTYLNPANWGRTFVGDDEWRNIPIVRRLELTTIVNNVYGVDYVSTLQLGVHLGTMGTGDITMSGPAPLPIPGTMTGSYV